MYERIANWITNRFIEKNIIEQEKQPIYAYGFEVLISNTIYTLIFLGLALLTQTFFESIVFWIGFFIVRTTSGGYHAPSYMACHIMFAANHILFVFLLTLFTFYPFAPINIALMVACCITIFFFAPVDHPNKRFTSKEFRKFKSRSRIYSIVILTLTVVLYVLADWNVIQFSYAIGTLSGTVSLVCAKINNAKRKEQ